jgi:hypothetical protein
LTPSASKNWRTIEHRLFTASKTALQDLIATPSLSLHSSFWQPGLYGKSQGRCALYYKGIKRRRYLSKEGFATGIDLKMPGYLGKISKKFQYLHNILVQLSGVLPKMQQKASYCPVADDCESNEELLRHYFIST